MLVGRAFSPPRTPETVPTPKMRAQPGQGFMRSTKSMEYHFSNAEQDAVRCAFLPTSFVSIRRLPPKMKAGEQTFHFS